MGVSPHSAQSITDVINLKNAKAVAFFLMLFFLMYHGLLMLIRPNSNLCKSLLSYGTVTPNGEWRPFGCMIHTYTTNDSYMCLNRLTSLANTTRLYFLGDSRLFVLFEVFAKHLNASYHPMPRLQANHSLPVLVKSDRFTLCFLPHDDSSLDAVAVLKLWRNIQLTGSVMNSNISSNPQSQLPLEHECLYQPPTHLVLSFFAGTIMEYNASEIGLLSYQSTLEALAESLSPITFKHVTWMLQDPVAEGVLSEEHKQVTNARIDAYNDVATRVLRKVPGLELWRSNRLIAQRVGFPVLHWQCSSPSPVDYGLAVNGSQNQSIPGMHSTIPLTNCTGPLRLSDGFHVSTEAMYQNMQALLNLYCNNHVKFEDGTCCRSAETVSPIQKRCFILIGLCLASTALCFIYDTVLRARVHSCWPSMRPIRTNRSFTCGVGPHTSTDCNQSPGGSGALSGSIDVAQPSAFDKFYELVTALSKFGLILVYFFVCDRTTLFMNSNKGFTTLSFLLSLVYLCVVGLFFHGATKETHVNHVDITREWKGWMQVYFLIYHLTGSYHNVPLHLFTRYLVSAYLFLSGFGHFHYMWHRRLPASLLWHLIAFRLTFRDLLTTARVWWDVLYRYLQVMHRMNFFVFSLCIVMNREYMFYYFMPLVSFWFTVLTLTVLAFPRVCAHEATLLRRFEPTALTGERADSTEQERVTRTAAEFRSSTDDDLMIPSNGPDSILSTSKATSLLLPPLAADNRSLSRPVSPTGRPSSFSLRTTAWRTHCKSMSLDTPVNSHDFNPRPMQHTNTTKSGPPWTERLLRKPMLPAEQPAIPGVGSSSSRQNTLPGSDCFCCRLRLSDLVILGKLVLLVVLVELLARSPAAFHWLFFSGPQRVLFHLDANTPKPLEPASEKLLSGEQAWFYRWSMDRYSVIYGMVFALMCEWCRCAGLLCDTSPVDLIPCGSTARCFLPSKATPLLRVPVTSIVSNCSNLLATEDRNPSVQAPWVRSSPTSCPQFNFDRSFTCTDDLESDCVASSAQFSQLEQGCGLFARLTMRRLGALIFTLIGLLGIAISIYITSRCPGRSSCTRAHTFLCLLPILSYILLRNCLGPFRRKFSVFFAWIGDISLELFIAQYHIWLSADGRGILVLLPGYPLLNLTLTSFIFVCICCEVHALTARLQRFLIPNSPLRFLRNLAVFFLTWHVLSKTFSSSSLE